jgi:hypothetical protein
MLAKSLMVNTAVAVCLLTFDVCVPTSVGAQAQAQERNSWPSSRNTKTTTRSYSGQSSERYRTPSSNANYDSHAKTREQIDQMHQGNGSLVGD